MPTPDQPSNLADLAQSELDPDYRETDLVIRQGDIIEFLEDDTKPASGSDWSSHLGIIVTANCDLAHRKHNGVLSYVPVVPISTYADSVLANRIFDTERKLHSTEIKKTCETNSLLPSYQRIEDMLETGASPEEILESIQVDTNSTLSNALHRLAACIAATKKRNDSRTFSDTLGILVEMYEQIMEHSPKQRISATDRLKKEIANRLRALPGDCFYFSQLNEKREHGWIAYLRILREINHETIAISAVHERRIRANLCARRIGRISILYLHRLLQQMTQVFTDIGLPESYERRMRSRIEGIVETWPYGPPRFS